MKECNLALSYLIREDFNNPPLMARLSQILEHPPSATYRGGPAKCRKVAACSLGESSCQLITEVSHSQNQVS